MVFFVFFFPEHNFLRTVYTSMFFLNLHVFVHMGGYCFWRIAPFGVWIGHCTIGISCLLPWDDQQVPPKKKRPAQQMDEEKGMTILPWNQV